MLGDDRDAPGCMGAKGIGCGLLIADGFDCRGGNSALEANVIAEWVDEEKGAMEFPEVVEGGCVLTDAEGVLSAATMGGCTGWW